ncbi:triadin-like isoform X2 [Prorops nasuta]|uniref:triadin-like isoform X2 n=1 Tax=Prorops nasuta TaxID=863751 RepID=UPI0034CE7411
MAGYAWVTLATNDSYSLGALVLGNSLKRVGTKHDLVVLVTPGVTSLMREKLASVFSLVQEVNVLDSKDKANLALLARPELGITFTKLHCWRLTQFEKCVFVDADTLVVRNCDELFEREELSAAPDVGWPDCFNSGVFVFKPSMGTFESIVAFAVSKGSFDGGDQGLLNSYFSDWAWKDISKHLPFIYNMCSTATYSYIPAFKQFGDNVRIIHFIGSTKPWLQYFDTMTGIVQPPQSFNHLQPLLQLWWNIFCELVHPQLTPNMAGLAGALAQITLGQPRSAEQIAFEEHMRKQSWEQGQIDFMGRDSFENIWKKICDTLSQAPQRQPTPPKESVEPKLEVEPEVEQITTDTAALSLETQTDKKAEEEPPSSQKIIENILEEKITEDIAATEPDYSKEVVNPILVAIQANVDQLCTELTSKLLESAAPVEETEEKSDKTSELIEATLENVDICPLTVSSEKAEIKSDKTVGSIEKALENIDVCPLTITPEKAEVKSDDTVESIEKAIENIDICPLSVSSEIISKEELLKESDKCPVPIQVAESVLQAEPKESVSEVPKPVEQIISSSVDILQEAVASRAEILAQATGLAPVSDLKNGDLEEGQEVSPLLTENRRVSLKSELLLTEDREQNVQLQTSANDSVEEKLKEPEPETIQSKELLQEPEQKLEIPLQELTSAVVEQEKKLESKIPTEGLKSEAEEQKTIIQAEEVKSESESKPAEIQEQKLTTESEVKTEIPVQELKSESETKSEAPVQELKAEPKPETLSQEIKSESEHKPEILSEESKLQGTELQSVPVELTTETKEVDTEATVQRPESTTEEQQVSVEGVTSEGQIPKKSVVAKGKDLELEIPPKTLEMAGDSGKLDIPPTPTVTEPTPPTSPPIQPEDVERSVKKNVKKVIKKTSSEDAGDAEGDSSGKKVTKKVVKKVIKKKDSEESQEGDKPKKPAKTAKKVAKPSPSLGPDTSVPETPPPASTSETPVPPKRKAKASTAKAATKSESES